MSAHYRLIDVVVSNCINSNINKIYAFTQFNSTSLNSHLSRAYSGVGLGKDGFVEVIAAYQSPDDNGWFQVSYGWKMDDCVIRSKLTYNFIW